MSNSQDNRTLLHNKLSSKSLLATYRYSWQTASSHLRNHFFSTLMTILVIAISLALPMSCYLVWKNIDIAAKQWYPTPQLTLYLDKTLNDSEAQSIADQLNLMEGVQSTIFLGKDQVLKEFHEWSGFSEDLNLIEGNPLPAVVMLLPTEEYQTAEKLKAMRFQLGSLRGIDDVRLDDGWFTRLAALTGLFSVVVGVIATLMLIGMFLVIGNTIRLTIFSRRNAIYVMRLIGGTDGFIMRPFLYIGMILGGISALLALIIAEGLIILLSLTVSQVAQVFNTRFNLYGLQWEECLIFLIIASLIGSIAAWFATIRYLYYFSPD